MSPSAVTPHQPVLVQTPIKPNARRTSQDVADEAAAPVADGSVEAFLAACSGDRDAVSNLVHEAIRRRNVGALRVLLTGGDTL